MLKIGVLASGTGTNLQSIIDNVKSDALKVKIAAIISDKKDAFAMQRAKRNEIFNIYIPPREYTNKKDYEQALINVMEEKGVELVILAGFMRILSPYIVDFYHNRIINIHPSLLPAFPGLNAQKQAFDYGAKVSGCTVHFVDEGMDTGPVILQKAVTVKQDDTLEKLKKRILKQEHKILPQAIKLYSENRLRIKDRKVIIND